MFNVGGGEIIVILLLALLVLGPDKLPDAARKAGRYLNEFRRMTSGFQEEFRQAMDLGGTDAESSEGDAVHRTTEGPRLLPQPPESPVAPAASDSPVEPAPPPATPPAPATFAVDVTPAPGTGPELITPPRPVAETVAEPDGEPGSSSAA